MDGSVQFKIPNKVIDRRTAPKLSDFKKVSDYSKYWGDKIELRIDILTEDVFRTKYKPSDISLAIRDLLSSEKQFNTKNLLALLEENKTFVFSVYSPNAFLPQSYSPVFIENNKIGESFFIAHFSNLAAPPNYAFAFCFAAKNTIIQIALSLNDYNDYQIPKNLPDYFFEHNDKWYWINRKAVDSLFCQINSTAYTLLPRQLQILREARDLLLASLEIIE